MVGFVQEVHVVRGDHAQAILLAPLGHLPRAFALCLGVVVLDFEEEILRAVDVAELLEALFRLVLAIGEEQFVDLAVDTTAEADDALRILAQQVFIDARPIPLAVQMRLGDEFAEIVEAFIRLREQREVRGAFATGDLLLFMHGAGREVDLAAEDGLHLLRELLGRGFFALFELRLRFAGGHVEVDRAVEIPVVRDGHRRHLILLRLLNHLINPHRAVEQRVVGVQMEMDEG